jgi:hypothetical protein
MLAIIGSLVFCSRKCRMGTDVTREKGLEFFSKQCIPCR